MDVQSKTKSFFQTDQIKLVTPTQTFNWKLLNECPYSYFDYQLGLKAFIIGVYRICTSIKDLHSHKCPYLIS